MVASRAATARLPRAERKEAILHAAAHRFAAGGYAATSVNDLADAAGVTPLILYRHFESKEHLYRSVLERAADEITSALTLDGRSPAYGISVARLLETARADPDGFTVLWRHAAREPEFSRHPSEVREQVLRCVRDRLDEHVPRELQVWAAQATVSYVIEAVLNWLEFGDPVLDRRFVDATEVAMRSGIRSWSHTASSPDP